MLQSPTENCNYELGKKSQMSSALFLLLLCRVHGSKEVGEGEGDTFINSFTTAQAH